MNSLANHGNIPKFCLLENAKDSLCHAVEHITHGSLDDIGTLKRVILDIFHAIELLLKERLYRIKPALVCKKIDLPKLDFSQTVSVDVAMIRLNNFDDKLLPRSTCRMINKFKRIRNNIIHYEFKLKVSEAKALIGRMISFIFIFSKENLLC